MDFCFLCQETTHRQCEFCDTFVCSDNHLDSHREKGNCLPYQVIVCPASGRHFVATRDIFAGEMILVDQPSVIGPSKNTASLCLECYRPIDKEPSKVFCECGFLFCSTCIKLKGGFHELECRQMISSKEIKTDESFNRLEYACIFFLRFWMLRQHSPDLWGRLTSLNIGDTNDLQETSLVEEMVEILQNKFGAHDILAKDIYQMMGIKRTNASNLASIGLEGVTALYPTYPLMNSYCYCNSRSIIDPKTFDMKVKAHRNIKSGEEISTRYVTVFEGQPRRRRMIWNGWKFICHCDRCNDPTEFGTYFSGVKCQNCDSGYILPHNTMILASLWKCNNCNQSYENSEIEEIVDDLESQVHLRNDLFEDPQCVISEVLHNKVHPGHFLVFQIKNTFFSSLIKNVSKKIYDQLNDLEIDRLVEKMEKQTKYGLELLNLIEILDPGYSGQKGTILKKIATLKMQFAKLKFYMTKDQNEYNEHMESSIEMLKTMALCL
ncbi:SET domain-containing protein SmydA-8 [Lepeophtheirus salmonis]|uniref:SET domain-containing protein SmydA-8 n=1 Tax=Lepeophtheirus salmonis TaxID=72036 RepID=UPI001AE94DE9|nr:SET domain-containing protein SmydA-8-like [Lepeophtheirus salmonis]